MTSTTKSANRRHSKAFYLTSFFASRGQRRRILANRSREEKLSVSFPSHHSIDPVVSLGNFEIRPAGDVTSRAFGILKSSSEGGGASVLTWSRDLTTFATGFHEIRTKAEGHKFGFSVIRQEALCPDRPGDPGDSLHRFVQIEIL
jgi:hypothetical protein